MSGPPRGLFGGAISSAIPSQFTDVSSFRQVPDNQEVFSDSFTDQCVIVELLEYEQDVQNSTSARFFFDELASLNGCQEKDIRVVEPPQIIDTTKEGPAIAGNHVLCTMSGDQLVSKFKEGDEAKNTVRVFVANLRLPDITTDVVISLSVPLKIEAASSSNTMVLPVDAAEAGASLFKEVVSTFQIKDWSLFG